MLPIRALAALLLPSLICTATAFAEPGDAALTEEEREAGFVPLFDGQSFEGWEGDNEWFAIEEGVIVAGDLDRSIPRNYFLTTEQEYQDFELRLRVKLVGGEGNSGIQFRSERHGEDVVGYQADVGPGWWGKLYDEHRRSRVLAGPEPEEIEEALEPDGWNEYRIRCEGDRVRLHLNGLKTVDYTEGEEEIADTGVIGLQIHGGDPAEVRFKNIRIKTLE